MSDLTKQEVDDGAAAYRLTQVKYWVSKKGTIRLEKYPDAAEIRHIPFLDNQGTVQLAHEARDEDGNVLGYDNDSNPCPPLC